MFEHPFRVYSFRMSALRLKDHANSFCDAPSQPIKFERDGYGSVEGVLVPFRTQKSDRLRLSHYCGTRVHGKVCPSLFTSGSSTRRAQGRPPMEAAFCVLRNPKTPRLELARKGRDEHMPIDTVDIFGSDQAGIHLASVANVLFHPPELPQPTVEILETCLELELHPKTIGGSSLVGALVCGNGRDIAVADIATEVLLTS